MLLPSDHCDVLASALQGCELMLGQYCWVCADIVLNVTL